MFESAVDQIYLMNRSDGDLIALDAEENVFAFSGGAIDNTFLVVAIAVYKGDFLAYELLGTDPGLLVPQRAELIVHTAHFLKAAELGHLRDEVHVVHRAKGVLIAHLHRQQLEEIKHAQIIVGAGLLCVAGSVESCGGLKCGNIHDQAQAERVEFALVAVEGLFLDSVVADFEDSAALSLSCRDCGLFPPDGCCPKS